MKKHLFFTFILFLVFVLLFIYGITYFSDNKLVKYQVYKVPIEEEIKQKNIQYKLVDCKDRCKQEICNEYTKQIIKYDLCNECAKENKCYDQYQEKCIECKDRQSCKKMFGCNNGPPINPKDNECIKCWPRII